MGTARRAQEAQTRARARAASDLRESKQREWRRREAVIQAQLASLTAELEAGQSELDAELGSALRDEQEAAGDKAALADARRSDAHVQGNGAESRP
jgi:hypothetical protein